MASPRPASPMYRDLNDIVLGMSLHPNLAAGRSELDRVMKQIAQDLKQLVAVSHELGSPCCGVTFLISF